MLLDLLVPARCLACGAPGCDLCAACRRALPFLDDGLCGPQGEQAFDAAFAVAAHEGPARDLVVALKFRAGRRAAREMAGQLAALAPPETFGEGRALVPAPAHPSRVRERGYDQAVLLARALGRRTGRPVARVLHRGGDAAVRQLGAGRAERLAGGRLEFSCRGRVPAQVVLVDDVHTTGATLDAAARALKRAGARSVVAVTYTRSL